MQRGGPPFVRLVPRPSSTRNLISSPLFSAAESAPRLPRPVSEVPEEETATRCVSSSPSLLPCARLTDIFPSPSFSQCGKPGHIARSCPEGGAYGQAGGFSNFGGPAKTCYNCGGQGHIAAACTSPPSGGFSRGAGGGACYSCGQVRLFFSSLFFSRFPLL